MYRYLCLYLGLVWLTASCSHGLVREDRWEQDGYTITIKEVPESRISAIEYSGLVDVPPERLWNVVTDIEAMFRLTNHYSLIEGPTQRPDNTIQMVFEIDPGWYAPAVTGTMIGRILPDQLGWENECASSVFEGCYMRFTILPAGDGKQSIINASGYVKRTWYLAHSHVVNVLGNDVRTIGAGLKFLAQLPKYERIVPGFPWEQLRHLAQQGPRPNNSAPAAGEAARARIAVQQFLTFPEAASASAVANVAADYLATQLMTLQKFDVVAPSDLNLMARYLGENWALLCADGEVCRKRLAGMAAARYLLSGELRVAPANYHLSLVLLDGQSNRAVWRMQRSVAADLQMIKLALDEASAALGATVLE